MKVLRVLPTMLREDPFSSMALDEALFQLARQELSEIPILRFYQFSREAISIGYHQRNCELIDSLSAFQVEWVRRPTGGGVVFHKSDLIFSLVLPIKIYRGFETVRTSYRVIHSCIQEAFELIGYQTTFYQNGKAPITHDPSNMMCFERPVCDDLMLEGEKIVGGAQRRCGSSVLHQGSIQNIRNSFVYNDLQESIISIFEKKFELESIHEKLTAEEYARWQELKKRKYENPDWNLHAKSTFESLTACSSF